MGSYSFEMPALQVALPEPTNLLQLFPEHPEADSNWIMPDMSLIDSDGISLPEEAAWEWLSSLWISDRENYAKWYSFFIPFATGNVQIEDFEGEYSDAQLRVIRYWLRNGILESYLVDVGQHALGDLFQY